MNERNDGGPAFPTGAIPRIYNPYDGTPPAAGMSLRDWFAGQALAGYVAGTAGNRESMSGAVASAANAKITIQQQFAQGALAIADAMLAERSKP